MEIVETYLADAGFTPSSGKTDPPFAGICVSSTGMVDTLKGEIFYSGETVPNYTGTKFKPVFEKAFGIPFEMENDVNCAGLAEYTSGAGAGSSSMLCLTVGTGIGGCAIIDGKVLHGATGSACEVGYMHMGDSDFQMLGSTGYMCQKVARRKGDTPEHWDGIRVFREADEGDRICREAIDEMCSVLGVGIANICYVLNPELVVLGGGIMAREAYLYPRIRAAIDRNLKPVIAQHTELKMAKYGNEAGMLGAYYHFRQIHG